MNITKREIWLTVAALLILLGGIAFFQYQRSNRLVSRPEIDFSDPNVIAISEGIEGDIHSLEIGVAYVGDDTANLAIYDNENTDVGMLDSTISAGSSIQVNRYFIIVLDINAADRTVVLEVLPDQQ